MLDVCAQRLDVVAVQVNFGAKYLRLNIVRVALQDAAVEAGGALYADVGGAGADEGALFADPGAVGAGAAFADAEATVAGGQSFLIILAPSTIARCFPSW